MAGDEILPRIDRSLERIDQHMARGNELMEENRRAFEENRRTTEKNTRAFEENRRAFEENRRAFEENRLFMRDLLTRWDKTTRAMIARLDAGTEQIRRNTETIREERREFVDEMRAQRAALFRILDRLGGGEATAGA